MSGDRLVGRAVAPLREIIASLDADQLGAPTPCAGFDVRRLVNHLLFWAPSLEGAARKEVVPPPAASDAEVDLMGGDWAAELAEQLGPTAAAWGRPEAWEGSTRLAGPDEVPATMVGGIVLSEYVLHGWDLARATGQPPSFDDEVLDFVLRHLEATADYGRSMGAFGPEVAVPADAPVLDRALGLSGRDPAWRGQ